MVGQFNACIKCLDNGRGHSAQKILGDHDNIKRKERLKNVQDCSAAGVTVFHSIHNF